MGLPDPWPLSPHTGQESRAGSGPRGHRHWSPAAHSVPGPRGLVPKPDAGLPGSAQEDRGQAGPSPAALQAPAPQTSAGGTRPIPRPRAAASLGGQDTRSPVPTDLRAGASAVSPRFRNSRGDTERRPHRPPCLCLSQAGLPAQLPHRHLLPAPEPRVLARLCVLRCDLGLWLWREGQAETCRACGRPCLCPWPQGPSISPPRPANPSTHQHQARSSPPVTHPSHQAEQRTWQEERPRDPETPSPRGQGQQPSAEPQARGYERRPRP